MKRAALLFVNYERLAQLLGLPAGMNIEMTLDQLQRDGVMLRVSGEGCPLVAPGDQLQELVGVASVEPRGFSRAEIREAGQIALEAYLSRKGAGH